MLLISSQENTEELKSAEKGNEYPCTTQPDKLGAEEVILPDVIGVFIILVTKMIKLERKTTS